MKPLRLALAPVVGKMCADCQRRAVTNPLRVFDCKVPEDQPIIETLPTISQFLDESCRAHYEEVKNILNAVGVPYVENQRLVRGFGLLYAARRFEFTHGGLGAQNAILDAGGDTTVYRKHWAGRRLRGLGLRLEKTGWCCH